MNGVRLGVGGWMGLEQACNRAGGGGSGVGVWSQISMGRFGCWEVRTPHSRLLPYVPLKPLSWGTFPNAQTRGSRGQAGLGAYSEGFDCCWVPGTLIPLLGEQ